MVKFTVKNFMILLSFAAALHFTALLLQSRLAKGNSVSAFTTLLKSQRKNSTKEIHVSSRAVDQSIDFSSVRRQDTDDSSVNRQAWDGLYSTEGYKRTTPKEENVTYYRSLQNERRAILQRECRRLNKSKLYEEWDGKNIDIKMKLLYSDRFKFILCEIPKCASSSMKKLLLVTEKLVNESDPRNVKSFDAHNIADSQLDLKHFKNYDEIRERIINYKKLIIVRDPLYRLLSAYRNKMEKYYPWSEHFADISKQIHSKYSPDDVGNILASFEEFLRYVAVDPQRDRHWEMYHKLCLPCMIEYDFIAHVETIGEDMKQFMKNYDLNEMPFPQNYAKSYQTNHDKFAEYFNEVSVDVLKTVYEAYKTDFELFGFQRPKLLNNEL